MVFLFFYLYLEDEHIGGVEVFHRQSVPRFTQVCLLSKDVVFLTGCKERSNNGGSQEQWHVNHDRSMFLTGCMERSNRFTGHIRCHALLLVGPWPRGD